MNIIHITTKKKERVIAHLLTLSLLGIHICLVIIYYPLNKSNLTRCDYDVTSYLLLIKDKKYPVLLIATYFIHCYNMEITAEQVTCLSFCCGRSNINTFFSKEGVNQWLGPLKNLTGTNSYYRFFK